MPLGGWGAVHQGGAACPCWSPCGPYGIVICWSSAWLTPVFSGLCKFYMSWCDWTTPQWWHISITNGAYGTTTSNVGPGSSALFVAPELAVIPAERSKWKGFGLGEVMVITLPSARTPSTNMPYQVQWHIFCCCRDLGSPVGYEQTCRSCILYMIGAWSHPQ